MTRRRIDSLDDEYCKAKGCQATLLVCQNNADGVTHHLTPTGPAKARVMRCIWCGQTQTEIETEHNKETTA